MDPPSISHRFVSSILDILPISLLPMMLVPDHVTNFRETNSVDEDFKRFQRERERERMKISVFFVELAGPMHRGNSTSASGVVL